MSTGTTSAILRASGAPIVLVLSILPL